MVPQSRSCKREDKYISINDCEDLQLTGDAACKGCIHLDSLSTDSQENRTYPCSKCDKDEAPVEGGICFDCHQAKLSGNTVEEEKKETTTCTKCLKEVPKTAIIGPEGECRECFDQSKIEEKKEVKKEEEIICSKCNEEVMIVIGPDKECKKCFNEKAIKTAGIIDKDHSKKKPKCGAMGDCIGCNKHKYIAAKGLCGTCYNAQNKPSKPRVPKPTKVTKKITPKKETISQPNIIRELIKNQENEFTIQNIKDLFNNQYKDMEWSRYSFHGAINIMISKGLVKIIKKGDNTTQSIFKNINGEEVIEIKPKKSLMVEVNEDIIDKPTPVDDDSISTDDSESPFTVEYQEELARAVRAAIEGVKARRTARNKPKSKSYLPNIITIILCMGWVFTAYWLTGHNFDRGNLLGYTFLGGTILSIVALFVRNFKPAE